MSRNPCINREDNIKISQFSYTAIVITITMKFLVVVNPLYIYQHQSNWVDEYSQKKIGEAKNCSK